MAPAFVLLTIESDVHKWPPLRPFRLPDQGHMGLVWESVPLACVTGDTGANNVFPGRQAAFVARQDVIEVQLLAFENLPAILAGVVVALEDVVPGKLHFFLRQPIEEQKHDHARHPNFPRNRRDHFVLRFRRRDGDIEPAREIVGREIILPIGRHNLGVPLIKKRKGTTRRADIDRLPEAIEHQNLSVK